MRMFRYRKPGGGVGCGVERAEGGRVAVGHLAADYDEAFFASGGLTRLRTWVGTGMPGGKELRGELDLLAPVARPSKIVCIGQNYEAHARELGGEAPEEPLVFMKASSAWSGPFDAVRIPPGAEKLDYEVELAVILEKRAVHVEQTDVLTVIAGYSVFCDYSERDYQKKRGGQWTKGKSYDHFAPMGPVLVTPDEVADPQALSLWSKVNGELRQDGRTADMIFPVLELVSHLSQFMTLLPGDVIATGTPAGVGAGYDPPRFLRPGDLVEQGIEGIGTMRQELVASEID